MNERAQRMENRLHRPLLLAALLVIPAVVTDQSSVGEPWRAVSIVLNWGIWVTFAAEVVLMVRVVDQPRRWLREHPLELAILILTPPFLPAGLAVARLLRLLRLLELAVLLRRATSADGVRDAAILALVTIFAGGAAFSAVERGQHLSVWDGIWWAITTVTTVGYGDIYPHTTAGRAIGITVMFVGIGFVAILTAAAAGRFLRAQQEEASELARVEAKLDEVLRRLDQLDADR